MQSILAREVDIHVQLYRKDVLYQLPRQVHVQARGRLGCHGSFGVMAAPALLYYGKL